MDGTTPSSSGLAEDELAEAQPGSSTGDAGGVPYGAPTIAGMQMTLRVRRGGAGENSFIAALGFVGRRVSARAMHLSIFGARWSPRVGRSSIVGYVFVGACGAALDVVQVPSS